MAPEKEQEYINRINELQAQLDEQDGLMAKCYEYVEEMKLRVSLAEGRRGKKNGGANAAQVKAYEREIQELRQFAELFDTVEFDLKKDEIQEYLKTTIKMRNDLAKLAESKHIKISRYESLNEAMATLEAGLLEKYISLATLVVKIHRYNKREDISKEEIDDLIEAIAVVPDIVHSLSIKIDTIESENRSLRKSVTNSYGETFDSLKEENKRLKQQVDAYRNKIDVLEQRLEAVNED